jgi:uncharacterized protein
LRKFEGWVEGVSLRFEFLVVILVAFGYFSIGAFFSFLSTPHKILITGEGLVFLSLYESLILFVLGWFLRKRGWTLAQLGFRPNWKSTLMSIGLIPVHYVIYALIWIFLVLLLPEIKMISHGRGLAGLDISLWKIILVSAVNPVFEELFVCGYVIQVLKKFTNIWIALIASTAIRTSYHLYQPIQGIVAIISLGLVFGFFYARTNRLWSVVVAHALLDLLGLLRLNHG